LHVPGAYAFVPAGAVKFLTPLERAEVDRAQTRRPKSETRKKPEARNPNDKHARDGSLRFGLRFSDFFRISIFGIRIWQSSAVETVLERR